MTTITRRAALAVPITLPLLPVSAFAQPADPIVTAFVEWHLIDRERENAQQVFGDLEREHGAHSRIPNAYEADTVVPVFDRLIAVERRIATMTATTPAGIACQVRILIERDGITGEISEDDVERRMLHSMLAGAENMAGVGS